VRQKAKDITNLLTDQERLRQERRRVLICATACLGQPPEESDEFPLDNENASRPSNASCFRSRIGPRRRGAETRNRASKRSLAEEQARLGEDTGLGSGSQVERKRRKRRERPSRTGLKWHVTV